MPRRWQRRLRVSSSDARTVGRRARRDLDVSTAKRRSSRTSGNLAEAVGSRNGPARDVGPRPSMRPFGLRSGARPAFIRGWRPCPRSSRTVRRPSPSPRPRGPGTSPDRSGGPGSLLTHAARVLAARGAHADPLPGRASRYAPSSPTPLPFSRRGARPVWPRPPSGSEGSSSPTRARSSACRGACVSGPPRGRSRRAGPTEPARNSAYAGGVLEPSNEAAVPLGPLADCRAWRMDAARTTFRPADA